MKVKLTKTIGEPIEIKIPESLSEVPLSNTIGFKTLTNLVINWTRRFLDEDETGVLLYENRSYYLYLIARAIHEFTDVPMSELLQVDVNDLVDEHGEVLIHVVSDHLEEISKEESVEIDLDTVEHTLLTIHRLILNLVNSFQFEYMSEELDSSFRWKGKTYQVPYIIEILFSGKKIFSHFELARTVEILQVKKYLQDHFKHKNLDEDNVEAYKNSSFSAFLNIMSLVCQEQDVPFPLDQKELTRQVQNKMKLFADVDTETAYRVAFFLITIIIKNAKPILNSDTGSNLLNTLKSVTSYVNTTSASGSGLDSLESIRD